MVLNYRYSRWDGSQLSSELDEDQVLERLSKEVLEDGDVSRALRTMFNKGLQTNDGERIMGLRELTERLRQQKRETLRAYNLDSVLDQLRNQLREVIKLERAGIKSRLHKARQQVEQASPDQREQFEGFMEILQRQSENRQEILRNLPENIGGQIQALQEYDFMDPEAQQNFQRLLQVLRQQILAQYFHGIQRTLAGVSSGEVQATQEMLQALNKLLEQHMQGLTPDFQNFLDRFQSFFDSNPPSSVDELLKNLQHQMGQSQSLLQSLSQPQQLAFQETLDSLLDHESRNQLAQLTKLMNYLRPPEELAKRYPFTGKKDLGLDEAMEAMRHLQRLDELSQQIQDVIRQGDISSLDHNTVEQLLGDREGNDLKRLQDITRILEEAGYVLSNDGQLQLTPLGIRRIGQKILGEVFTELRKDRLGSHPMYDTGSGGEYSGETKKYEFGDLLEIDLRGTMKNAVVRQGPQLPIKLEVQDFEIKRTEHTSQAATVLLLDQSRSMGMFGNFIAAKKVAVALQALIQTRYPRDKLFMIGFSDYAMELKPVDLPYATWNDWVSGTNMHHAFLIARKLLAREHSTNKQILMVTDGEPTAHLEGGYSYFSYPPSYDTIEHTLNEVKRCTQAGITINTFMLETNSYLLAFVDKMTRLNNGRAFYSAPNQLGEYVLVDYMNHRSKRVR